MVIWDLEKNNAKKGNKNSDVGSMAGGYFSMGQAEKAYWAGDILINIWRNWSSQPRMYLENTSAEHGVFQEKQQYGIVGVEGTRAREILADGEAGGMVNDCC